MRVMTTILLIAILTKSYCQEAIGVGLVKVNFEDRTVLSFYKNPTDIVPYKNIEFFFDVEIDGWTIENMETENKWLRPEVFGLDDDQFAFFRCKSKIADWFELIVNKENGTTLWVKQSQWLKFLTWEEYLKGMFVISRMKNQKQQIRKLPDDTSEEVKYEGGDCFNVKDLKGDWIEILTADDCDIKFIKTKLESGWIKWREGDKLLIDYYRF